MVKTEYIKVGKIMNRGRFVCILLIMVGALLFSFADAYAISWKHDLKAALKQAEKKKKPVLVDFYTDRCGWCKKMDKDTYAAAKVKKLATKFICVKINGDDNAVLAKKYSIRGYPLTIFFNSSGKVVKRISGYKGPTDFAKAMDEVLSKQKSSKGKAKKSEAKDQNKKKKKKFIWSRTTFDLTGIIDDPKEPLAVINGSLVGVGDIVDNAEVVEIKKRNVVIRYKNKKLVLNIK